VCEILNTCTSPYVAETCDLPLDLGECAEGEEPVTRYWHNPETRQCQRFKGCDGGNANNFLISEDCWTTCEPCPVVDCIPDFIPCAQRGLVDKKSADGCDTCQCLSECINQSINQSIH
jgi:hypothetical protein